MFYRGIYRAWLKPDAAKNPAECLASPVSDIANTVVDRFKIHALSLFYFGDMLSVYVENTEGDIEPDQVLSGFSPYLLDVVEGTGKKWRRMWELFHYSGYADENQWQRMLTPKQGIMRVNRLRPEMFSSYVFYHHQLQEEHPGRGDKYGLICFDDGMMCFYLEEPTEKEVSPAPGKLTTQNSPLGQWGQLMGTHFVPWEDTDKPWKDMQSLYSFIPEK